ncbi:uncharacterized protein LOC126944347 [Macaca thibetana thibetana]|uniref:uncharacterized protein LOC126944347 n=1 Tax=Macaca thibetana thibetana TaxID=257877 RepID=UPI0021BC92EA|nr:uncharacterized protein LOC126944347 [Macaca thibetana thibetana]
MSICCLWLCRSSEQWREEVTGDHERELIHRGAKENAGTEVTGARCERRGQHGGPTTSSILSASQTWPSSSTQLPREPPNEARRNRGSRCSARPATVAFDHFCHPGSCSQGFVSATVPGKQSTNRSFTKLTQSHNISITDCFPPRPKLDL